MQELLYQDEITEVSEDTSPAENQPVEYYNETDSDLFVNFKGKKTATVLGAVALGAGAALLAKDLINKNKAKKKKAAESKETVVEEIVTETVTPPVTPPSTPNTGSSGDGGKKNNTLLYVGIGAGVLLIAGTVIFFATRKN